MPAQNFAERLASGQNILMDGGTGSELQRRGVNIARGWNKAGDIGPWSAVANKTAPDAVRQIHTDYLDLGVDIITTNTFWGNRSRMGVAGLADHWEEYTRLAAEIALAARDAANPEAYVAAGIAPSPGRGDSYKDLRDQAAVLAEMGVDAILTEYVGSVAKVRQSVHAAAPTGLPLLLGLCHFDEQGRLNMDGGTMADVVEAIDDEGVRVDSILLMCSAPEEISRTMPMLQDAFDGPVGAYSNVGYTGSGGERGDDPDVQLRGSNIGENTPESYARFGQEWLDMGVQIVGGCCATTPDHIAALAPIVKPA
jgi:S-methylmethionine-dependent homocysteine/selenocysteine methylase